MIRLNITANIRTPVVTSGYLTLDAILAGILWFDQLQDVKRLILLSRSSRPMACFMPVQCLLAGLIKCRGP